MPLAGQESCTVTVDEPTELRAVARAVSLPRISSAEPHAALRIRKTVRAIFRGAAPGNGHARLQRYVWLGDSAPHMRNRAIVVPETLFRALEMLMEEVDERIEAYFRIRIESI